MSEETKETKEKEVKETKEKKERVFCDYEKAFAGITPEMAFDIAIKATSFSGKSDDYLQQNGYLFNYGNLSTFLKKYGYTTGWYKEVEEVVISETDANKTFSNVGKTSDETAKAWKDLDVPGSKETKSILLDYIVRKGIEDFKNGKIVLKKDEAWAKKSEKEDAAKEIESLKKQMNDCLASGNFEEVQKISEKLLKLNKIVNE